MNRLSRMRGAALKLGQMLSLEGEDFLPPEVAKILQRLRSDADVMPEDQVRKVMKKRYGKKWETLFQEFDYMPFASASLGQVHRAKAKDGRDLALKIQYPGVRKSIDSDVDNLATMLSVFKILPAAADFSELIAGVKRQLHQEADYLREMREANLFREKLADYTEFVIPEVFEDLTTPTILAMEYVEGEPIEHLADDVFVQKDRDRVGEQLLELLLLEIFSFHRIQTDPNFANYLYQADTHRLVLLDFGASRKVRKRFATGYRLLVDAVLEDDPMELEKALDELGVMGSAMIEEDRDLMVQFVMMAAEPLRCEGPYDFQNSTLTERIRAEGFKVKPSQKLRFPVPPPEFLFYQRKLAGMFLLCKRIHAKVDCQQLLREQLPAA